MDSTIKRAMFNIKTDKVERTTISIPTTMFRALKQVAAIQGEETIPTIILQGLDAWLIELAKGNMVSTPEQLTKPPLRSLNDRPLSQKRSKL